MSGVLYALIQVILTVLNMLQLLIILSAFISWFSADPRNPLVNIVRTLTEPLYAPVRRHITGRLSLPVDLSPIVILLAIFFIKELIRFYV
ncbi:MAG: YggT family protein [Oligoflexales bacterium]|nr:YggT family protein [Oligoflexales bacterium]